jgi:preprotein translocase subunit SecB
MTRDGGFPALMLNPVDFAAMYQAQQQNQNTAAA